MLESIFNPTIGKLLLLPEPFGIIAISFLLTLIVTLSYKYLTNQTEMKELKGTLKKLQEEYKAFSGQEQKKNEIRQQMLEKNMKYMIAGFKPMLFTLIPLLLIFSWLNGYYTSIGNPKVFIGLSWIWTYIIFSIVFSLVLRKILKVY